MIPFLLVFVAFLRILRNALKDPAFGALTTSVVIVLAVGTSFYAVFEDWGVLDSLYFSVVALTTVGFGDVAPETALAKAFTILYIFVGLGLLMTFVTTIVQRSHLWARFDVATGEESDGSSAQGGNPKP
jgi:voltage-gated potassium channel